MEGTGGGMFSDVKSCKIEQFLLICGERWAYFEDKSVKNKP